MSEQMERCAAIRLISAAKLPTVSLEERESLLGSALWEPDDESPITTKGPVAHAVGALPIVREESGYPRLVQREPPDDPGDPRYDELITELLAWRNEGVTNQYISDELARIGHPGVAIVGEPELLQPCPCCGYRTLTLPGEYDICKVCFWEDNGARQPEQYSSPNGMTLGEGRRNYQAIGAGSPDALSLVDRTPGKYVRAVDYSQE